MAEIPIQSRFDKSLSCTRTFLKEKSIKKTLNEGNDSHEQNHLSLLMENQRIEDAYLIKESENKKVASMLRQQEEQVLELKAAHDQAESNLVAVLDDLQTAIIENQKLNSEKLIDNENITTVKVENQIKSQKLENLQKRFSKFVKESLKMTSKQGELISLLEESDDKLMKQGRELERESEKSRLFKEENDALMKLSLDMERTIKRLESEQMRSLAEFDKVTMKLQAIEANHLDQKLNIVNENAEIVALREQCSRQEIIFKEQFQSEVNRVKSEYASDKMILVKEIEQLADKNHELHMTCDRAIREKRSAESELHLLLNVLPNQTDALEGNIDELNRRLAASEKQRIEALHSAEAIHQKYINQLSIRDLEERSYQSAIYNAGERARKAETEYERVTIENVRIITKISDLEHALATAMEEKSALMSSYDLEKSQYIEEHKRKVSQLEKSLSEAKQSADMSSKEVHQLLNQQRILSSKWKQEADHLCKKHDASISLVKTQMVKMQQRLAENEEERLKLKAIKSDLIKQIGLAKQENAAFNERLHLSESRNLSLERQIAAIIGKESLRILERHGIQSSDVL